MDEDAALLADIITSFAGDVNVPESFSLKHP